uniref:Uncharacterized protein n=1 Tax=Romanomermis culicivorax TaxID=13658 RepID=A0A915HJW5_ROMCU
MTLKPENPLSVGKDYCNFAENDRQQHPTEPNGTKVSLSFGYVPSIAFHSVGKGRSSFKI